MKNVSPDQKLELLREDELTEQKRRELNDQAGRT